MRLSEALEAEKGVALEVEEGSLKLSEALEAKDGSLKLCEALEAEDGS